MDGMEVVRITPPPDNSHVVGEGWRYVSRYYRDIRGDVECVNYSYSIRMPASVIVAFRVREIDHNGPLLKSGVHWIYTPPIGKDGG